MEINVSIIAPAHRTHYWMDLYRSINTKLKFEVIFVTDKIPDFELPENFKYIYSTVKPAQCVEIALREAKGEVFHWTSDTTLYSSFTFDAAYYEYKKANDYKTMVSFRNFEGTGISTMGETTHFHYLFDRLDLDRDAKKVGPRTMPYGMMSTKFANELGRLDRRFIAGQWDNDLVMRGYEAGGNMIMSEWSKAYTNEERHDGEWNLRGATFKHETKLLKQLWTINEIPVKNRQLPLEPFEDKDLLTVTQGHTGVEKIWK